MKRYKILKLSGIILFLTLLLLTYFLLGFEMRTNDSSLKHFFTEYGKLTEIHYSEGVRSFKVLSEMDTEFTILFVHGAPGSGDQFKSYMIDSSLTSVAHVVSVDRPGYGYSRFGQALVNIKTQAEALENVINNTINTSQKIILVSHSFAGPICAYLCILMKERIHSHVMLNPVIDPYSEKMFWYSPLPIRWPFKYFSSGAMKVASYEKLSHVNELKKLENVWEQVEVPTIHVQGMKDWLAPKENADFTEDKFNTDYLDVIRLFEDSHFIPFTKKDFVIQLIMESAQMKLER